MPGGEQTASELDALTSELMGAGKGAEHFQAAMAQVSDALDAAKRANAEASEALVAGQAHYRDLERAVVQAAKAAEKAALKNDGVVPDDLAARLREADTAVGHYAGALAKLEADAKHAAAEEDHLAKTLGNVKKLSGHVDKSIAGQAERLGKLQGSLGAVGGPLGALGQKLVGPVKGFSELSGAIGSARAAALLGAVGIAAVAAAVVAVTAAAVAGVAAVAAWAVGLADAKRNAGLAKEAFEVMHPDLVAIGDDISNVSRETGLSEDSLRGIVKSLEEAKVSAEDMPDALRAAALAERALGQGGASEFVSQIKEGSRAVSDLAYETQNKLGGVVARQMMGLDAQGERFKRNISDLFGGLNINPVLSGFQRLVDLFDENTSAGQAMRSIFEGFFQPLIDQADNAAIAVERFALGFLIGLTKVYIAIKPVIRAVEDFFGFDDNTILTLMGDAKDIGEAVAYALTALVGVFGLVIAALLAIPAAIAGAVAAFMAFWQMVGTAGASAALSIRGAITGAIDWVRSIDIMQVGRDLLQGLANGITGAAGVVRDAVSNAVNGAIKSAKQALGIASPSKVFAGFGELTAEGYAQGVEATTPDAQAALTTMVEPPAIPSPFSAREEIPARPTAAAATSDGGSSRVDLSGATFVFNGVANAETAAERFEEVLTRILEGDAARLGTEAAPA